MLKTLLFPMALILAFGAASQNLPPLRLVSEVFEPYQYFEDGMVVGSNVDMLSKLFQRAGIKMPQVELYPWARAYQMAKTTPNTLIFPVVRSEEREADLHWIAPLAVTEYFLFGLKSRQDIQLQHVADAKSLALAVTINDIAHKYLNSKGFEDEKDVLIASDWANIERLFFTEKLDLLVSSNQYFKKQLATAGKDPDDYESKLKLTDLQVRYYLAVNPTFDEKQVALIKQQAPQVLMRF